MPIKKADNTKKHSSSFIISKVEHSKIKTIFDIIHIDDLRSKLFFLILKYDTDLIANMHHKNDQQDNKAYLTNYEALFWLNKKIQQELIYYVHQNQLFPDIFYTVHSDDFNKKIFEKRLPFYITWYSPKEVNKFIKQYQEYDHLINFFICNIIEFSDQSRDLKNKFYINIEDKYKSFIFYKNGEFKSSIAPNNSYNNGSLLSARIFIKSLIYIYKYFYHSSDQNFYAEAIEKCLIKNLSDYRIKRMRETDPPFEKFLPLKETLLHLILYYSCTDNLVGIDFFLFLHKHFLRQNKCKPNDASVLNNPLLLLPQEEFNTLFKETFTKKLHILYQKYDVQENDPISKDLAFLFDQILENNNNNQIYIPNELDFDQLVYNLLDQYTRCGFLDLNAHIDLLQIQLKPYCVEYHKPNRYLPGRLFYCKHNFFISSNTLTPNLLDHIARFDYVAKKEKQIKKICIVTDSYKFAFTNDNATLILNKSVEDELKQLKINTFTFDLNEYIGSLKSEDITNQDILFFKKHIFLLNIRLLRKVNILYIDSHIHCPEISLLSDITHIIEQNFLKHEYLKLLKHFNILKDYIENFLSTIDFIKNSHQINVNEAPLIKYINQERLEKFFKEKKIQSKIDIINDSLNSINNIQELKDIQKLYTDLIKNTKKYLKVSEPILTVYEIVTGDRYNCLCDMSSSIKQMCKRRLNWYKNRREPKDEEKLHQYESMLKNKKTYFFLTDCINSKQEYQEIWKS